MKKKYWKKRIEASAKSAGTYRPYFDAIIETLADILEQRDSAQDQYMQTGARPVVAHTSKTGATNIVKNPALVIVMDLNQQALQYWRDLGLTPSGLKKLNEKAMQAKGKKGFGDVLNDIL